MSISETEQKLRRVMADPEVVRAAKSAMYTAQAERVDLMRRTAPGPTDGIEDVLLEIAPLIAAKMDDG